MSANNLALTHCALQAADAAAAGHAQQMKAAEAAAATKQAETEVEHQAALLAQLERCRVRMHFRLQLRSITDKAARSAVQVGLPMHLIGPCRGRVRQGSACQVLRGAIAWMSMLKCPKLVPLLYRSSSGRVRRLRRQQQRHAAQRCSCQCSSLRSNRLSMR